MYWKRVEQITNTLIELVFENENRKRIKFEYVNATRKKTKKAHTRLSVLCWSG